MVFRREIKILKYIYWRKVVTGKQLTKRFPDIDYYYEHLKNNYVDVGPARLVLFDSVREKKHIADDEPVFYLNIYGDDVVLKNRHEFWTFFLPYSITTAIALISMAPTVPKIINYICRIFSSGICP